MPSLIHVAVALAVAGKAPAEPPTPSSFAKQVTARARSGWRVAELEVSQHADRGAVSLAVVMAKGVDAERHRITFADWGDEVVSVAREAVAAPVETRVYPGAVDLIEALGGGPPARVYDECGSVILEAGGRSVLIDEQEYYVVTAQARGRDAQQLLAQAMARSLRAGRALAMVDLPDEPGARFADFIFVDSDQETVHAELDARGQVIAVEVRHSPSGVAWQTYRGGKKLARALEHRSVEGLSIRGDEDGAPRIDLRFTSGQRFVLDMEDVTLAPLASECPC
jgi:hypothetical protein